jgi:AraC-like DNA-binding protein
VLDYAIANAARIARQLTEHPLTLTRVDLARPAPPSDAPYREVFRAEVRFGVSASGIWMSRGQLDLPVTPGDPRLHAMLTGFAEERLARLPAPGDLVDEVRAALRRALDGTGRPQAPSIARRLGMSERTLSRRLREHEQGFAALLDEVSRGAAVELLERGTTTTEVAFLLGFSELSAFHRAFHRWTGVTPGDFRRRCKSPDGGARLST